MSKRLISLLLALMMLLSLGTAAFADGAPEEEIVPAEESEPAQVPAEEPAEEPQEAPAPEEVPAPVEPETEEEVPAEEPVEEPAPAAEPETAAGTADTEFECGAEGSNVTGSLADGVLTIQGTGAMKDFSYFTTSEAPWHGQAAEIQSIVIQDGVTTIGAYAFYECQAKTVTIPDSVTSIGEGAFELCKSLGSVTIPDSVTSLGAHAFNGSGVTSVKLSAKLKEIGQCTLAYCDELTSVTIPEGVTVINTQAFYDDDALASVSLPGTLTEIGVLAFGRCPALTSVTLPEGLETISREAFVSSGLVEVTLPASVTRVEAPFSYCQSMQSVTVLNPDCAIYNYDEGPMQVVPASIAAGDGVPAPIDTYELLLFCEKSVTIKGYDGSTAQAYAKKYGNDFVALDGGDTDPSTPTPEPTATPEPTPTPAPESKWVKSGGKWQYYDENGELQTGRFQAEGKWYFADDNGAMQTGWIEVPGSEGDYYYAKSSGELVTGDWVKSGGKWYYMDEESLMVHDGLHDVDGS